MYAVLKQIQWQWPEQYGENKFVIMFGGLHIEMAALKSIGTLLQSIGWTSAIVEADIASSGTAESICPHLVLLEHDKPTRSRLAACTSSLRMPMNITATKLLQMLMQSFRLRPGTRSALKRIHNFISGI